jgi:ADP-ribose pyrophosphatase YjhB (NUDIX family)
MRERNVVVAIVRDGAGRFLLTYNNHWDGFSFPMTVLADGTNPTGERARAALARDLRAPHPHATADQFATVRLVGPSGSTGEDTLYHFTLFEVTPNEVLDLSAVPVWNESRRPVFATRDELLARRDLTWTVPALVREFVDSQDVALAVVTRPGDDGPEFLLVNNERFGGYFFPVRRVRAEGTATPTAVGAVRADTGYTGPALAEYRGEVSAVQHSPRFDRARNYRFHVCGVALPDIDLHRPGGPLERALGGRAYRWLTASQLRASQVPLSPTVELVRAAVEAVPTAPPTGRLPVSEGALALVTRGDKRLVLWNENWGAFFLVGGHKRPNETFRECAAREIGEELGLQPSDYTLGAHPVRHEYRAVSGRTGVLTEYALEVFDTTLTPAALARLDSAPRTAWVTDAEIRELETHSGQPISPTVSIVLS